MTNNSTKKKLTIKNQPTQLSIRAVLEKKNVDAKIRWCLKVVKFKFSQRSYNDLQSFSFMFPDSGIARKMTLQKDKCKYIINHQPEPYCEKLLMQNVTASPCHSLSFNEPSTYGVDVLHRPASHLIFSYWVG